MTHGATIQTSNTCHHKDSNQRKILAIALGFAATTLLSLEALHPGSCAWLGLNNEQSFSFSAIFATVNAFLAALTLARLSQTESVAATETQAPA